ncbi:MAG: 6-phosphofructokinase, partial [Desulfovibrio sp.]|nr:6-phosphofructokinase [Desulfovibrio sp.]
MSRNQTFNTAIRTLGPRKLESRLPYRTWADDAQFRIVVDDELSEDGGSRPSNVFEAAGPRRKLYFDTTRAKCAIVTCGGLCPGINDVIRAIVLEAFYAYNVPSVLGIPYGLEGFIPKYKHRLVELTPAMVADIHRFGGTMLGSSRGPQPAEEIVDTLERCNVNALFIIGGDGT